MHEPSLQNEPSRRHLLELGAGLLTGGALAGCAAPSAPAPAVAGSGGEAPPAESADRVGALDELFGGLHDQRGTIAPIAADEYRPRRERLGALLAARDLDALLIEPGATMRYLSDVRWSQSKRLFALVVLADGSHLWVCPAFEAERARRSIDAPAAAGGELVLWDEHEYPYAPLAAALRARRAARVGVEPWVRHRFPSLLARELGQGEVVLGQDVLLELRGRKDEHELALLRRANELTHQALVAVHETLEPDLPAREIRARVRHAQARLGLEQLWDLTLIGPAAALPHGAGGDEVLRTGDPLLIDTGGALHGYQSDNTRTWVPFGEPRREIVAVWNAVRDAQARAFEAIRPGVRCRELDAIARDSLERSGYGPGYRYFTHRLGHGIGLEGHEDPYLDGGSEVVLAPGMTFSDEPGVYILGEFGCRIEHIVAVVEDGAEVFASWQQGVRSPA